MSVNSEVNAAAPSAAGRRCVPQDEHAEGLLEATLVTISGPFDQLEQRLRGRHRVTGADRGEELRHGPPRLRAQPSDRAEVEHAERAVPGDEDVARVEVDVEASPSAGAGRSPSGAAMLGDAPSFLRTRAGRGRARRNRGATPSSRSITSTRPPLSAATGTGTRMCRPSASARPAATPTMLSRSIRKSSSSRSAAAKPAARSRTPRARPQSVRPSSVVASRATMSRSRSTSWPIPGRWTLTHDSLAGAQPGGVDLRDGRRGQGRGVALGEELLVGRARSRRGPRSAHVLPRDRRGAGPAGCASSSTNSSGSRSCRVDSCWPSLTNVTPPSSSARRSDRARSRRSALVPSAQVAPSAQEPCSARAGRRSAGSPRTAPTGSARRASHATGPSARDGPVRARAPS